MPTLNVAIRAGAIEAPEAIAAGLVTFRLKADGDRDHHLVVLRVPTGMPYEEVRTAIAANRLDDLFLTNFGGPEMPPDSATPSIQRTELRQGRYVLVCLRRHADGRTHAAHGEFRPIGATPVTRFAAFAPPIFDGTIRMHDGEVVAPAVVRAGQRVFQIENRGSSEHGIILQRLDDGDSTTARKGTGTYRYAGGISKMSPRRVVWATFVLTPGKYRVLLDADPHRGTNATSVKELTVTP
jgi:hypothetical protein